MQVLKTKLEGVLLVKLDVFKDHRGEYVEIYNEELYDKNGIHAKFIQDDISVSKKNVLRGIHGDKETCKLISCLWGEFFLAVVNADPKSAQFRQWETFVLSAENRFQVFIPPCFGNGHYVLSETAVFHYKQSTYYHRESQFTMKWNDREFNIPWPCKDPILSRRDG